MKLKARDVDAALRRPNPDIQAFLIYGPDSGLVRERADTLAAALMRDPDDPFAVTRFTDEDLKGDPAALADAMAAMSLLGEAPLVRVRLSGDMAAVGAYLTSLDKGELKAEARLIIEAGDLKKASKLRKAAEDGTRFAAAPCYADDARDLVRLAEDMFKSEGLTLAPDARAMLAPFLEGDRALARSEIEKLILYKGLTDQRGGEPATVERADIAAISAAGAEAALDQIIDPAFGGDPASADRAYAKALDSGISAVAILRVMQRRIDQIDHFHALGGDGTALARSGAPRFGPAAEAFKASASRWRSKRLEQARRLTFETEREIKRSGAPVEALVGALLLRLARAASGRR